jgi:hypothetical protein
MVNAVGRAPWPTDGKEAKVAFEIFTREIVRSVEPTVTITTMGRIALNKSATAVLEKSAVEYVLMLWDKESNRAAIRPIGKKDRRSYRLSYGTKGNGAGFSAVTFLNFIKYDWSKTRSFAIEWVTKTEDMYIFTIPQEHLTGMPEKQNTKLGQVRRSDRATGKDSGAKEAAHLTP